MPTQIRACHSRVSLTLFLLEVKCSRINGSRGGHLEGGAGGSEDQSKTAGGLVGDAEGPPRSQTRPGLSHLHCNPSPNPAHGQEHRVSTASIAEAQGLSKVREAESTVFKVLSVVSGIRRITHRAS